MRLEEEAGEAERERDFWDSETEKSRRLKGNEHGEAEKLAPEVRVLVRQFCLENEVSLLFIQF